MERAPEPVPVAEWPYRDRRPRAPMEADEVVRVVVQLETAGVAVWLDGGWGVDALLEEQVREHDDLDLVAALADVPALLDVLGRAGYEHVAGAAPGSVVLVDARGRQVDVHPVVLDDARGGGVYVMDDGREWVYPTQGFGGRGLVADRAVRCLSPEVQVLVHDGYELTDKDHLELDLLHGRFGVDVPPRGNTW
jgi:lincosamide nucleotidyltransferase A/C/D/E